MERFAYRQTGQATVQSLMELWGKVEGEGMEALKGRFEGLGRELEEWEGGWRKGDVEGVMMLVGVLELVVLVWIGGFGLWCWISGH